MSVIYPAVIRFNSTEKRKLEQLKKICKRVHIDVMDNIFVPNVSSAVDVVNDYIEKNNFFVWIHLMVELPLAYHQQLELPANSIVSFHIESSVDVFKMIKSIKEKKQLASIAISPKTPISEVISYVNVVDQILVMSVEPGFSGQPFLNEVLEKIEGLNNYRQEANLKFRIAVDGGVNKNNIGI